MAAEEDDHRTLLAACCEDTLHQQGQFGRVAVFWGWLEGGAVSLDEKVPAGGESSQGELTAIKKCGARHGRISRAQRWHGASVSDYLFVDAVTRRRRGPRL